MYLILKFNLFLDEFKNTRLRGYTLINKDILFKMPRTRGGKYLSAAIAEG